MGNSLECFIRPVMAVTPPPRTDDVATFMAVYAKVLDEFDDATLEYAADTLIRTARMKAVPTPAECVDACREAARALELRRMRAGRQKPAIPEQFMWTREDAQQADKLFASEWGRRAVADGIEIGLWDFLVKQQRWPTRFEYDDLKIQSKAVQAESRAFLRIQQENGGIKSDAKAWLNTLKRQSDRLKQIAPTA